MWTKSFILQVIIIDILFFWWYYGTSRGVKEFHMCFIMTHTFFFALFFLVVQINSSHFLSRCLSHFFSLGRRRRRRRRRRGKDRGPSERQSRAKKPLRKAIVLRRRKEWSWSSSSSSKRERRQNHHRFSFGADSLREFQFKWPTTRRRRPNKSRRRLMVVVRLRGLHKHPTPRNTTKTLYYPWWRKSQRWTGPCTRPASCPFYSAFTRTLGTDDEIGIALVARICV